MNLKTTLLTLIFVAFSSSIFAGPQTILSNTDNIAITKSGGLVLAQKNGTDFLSTMNGRYVITGGFKIHDLVNDNQISTFSDVRQSINKFNIKNSVLHDDNLMLVVGRGSKEILISMDASERLPELRKAINSFTDEFKSNYKVKFLFNAKSLERSALNSQLYCNFNGVLKNGFKKDAKALCESGNKKVISAIVLASAYELTEFATVIDENNVVHRNINNINEILQGKQ